MNEQFYIALLGCLSINVLIWLWIDSKLDKILHEINPTKYKVFDLEELMDNSECNEEESKAYDIEIRVKEK